MEIGQIVKGHINEVLGLHKNLLQERLRICYSCPLYSKILGGVCNRNLWINPNTNEISNKPKDGYIRGCGCRVRSKSSLPNGKCVINKW